MRRFRTLPPTMAAAAARPSGASPADGLVLLALSPEVIAGHQAHVAAGRWWRWWVWALALALLLPPTCTPLTIDGMTVSGHPS